MILIQRVVVAVLDNFHFDLSLVQSTHQEDEGTNTEQRTSFSQEHCEGERTSVVREADGLESEESQEELEMEADESEVSVREQKEKSVGEDGDLMKQRAMAQKIHKAIVNSILPSLEGVLTKRVSRCCTHIYIHVNYMYMCNIHVHVHNMYMYNLMYQYMIKILALYCKCRLMCQGIS